MFTKNFKPRFKTGISVAGGEGVELGKMTQFEDSRKFISFENPIYPFFYSATVAGPSKKYKDKYLMGGWFIKFRYGTTAIVDAPITSFKQYGDYFLNLITKGDKEFCKTLFDLGKELIKLGSKLEVLNFRDLKTGRYTELHQFYSEAEEIYAKAIGLGYSLDFAFDEYIKENHIDIHKLDNKHPSFTAIESFELCEIFAIKNKKKSEEALAEHALKYSWLKNDYSGAYPMTLEDFVARNQEVISKKVKVLTLKLTKPSSMDEWISFLTMMRDQRKKCNLIMDSLLDRYLQEECKRYGLQRKDAVMLTVAEFERQKTKGIKKYKGTRTSKITNYGMHDITERQWKQAIKATLIIQKKSELKGVTAMPGKVIGLVRIILSRADFGKIHKGDVLVTSMTRPEFTQVLRQISAIITNEGGVTSHAAIISRELGIPCVIGTHNATKVLKDGDRVEVDATSGIIKIL